MTVAAAEAGRQCAQGWLEVLLARAERGAAKGTARAIVTNEVMLRAYKKSNDVDFRRSVHEFLDNVRVREAVDLVWEPHYKGHDLKKLRLKNVAKLRDLLGVRPLTDIARNAIQDARAACQRADGAVNPQLELLLEGMEDAWRRGHLAYGLRVDATEEVAVVLKTVAAILNAENHGLDMRTFSVRIHGNGKTKVIENNRRAIERLLQILFPSVDGQRFDLLAYLGLEKTPQPFFIGGQHCIRLRDGRLIPVQEYLGFPRARIAEAEIESPVVGFLIIENWTTYAKAASSAPGQWLILFCSGFPSPGWIEIVRQLIAQWPNAPILHWGDVDLGGFRIFEHLHSRLSNQLRPYWMTPVAYVADATNRQLTDSDIRELRRMANRMPALQSCIDEIIATKRFGLEQEAIHFPENWVPS